MKGLVHRDIKPANIMITREDKLDIVKLVDFGISKVLNEKNTKQGLTQTGDVFGSPLYMLNVDHNQFTAAGNRQAPFDLRSCRIEQLSGRPVLVIEGRFGTSGTMLKGVFVDRTGTGEYVNALSVQAPDAGEFLVNTPAFNSILRSIRWK